MLTLALVALQAAIALGVAILIRRTGGLMASAADLQAQVDRLTADVTAEKTAEDSAIALLQGLKAQLDAALAAGTPDAVVAQVQQVADAIEQNTASLGAAVAANQPAAAPPTP